MNPERITGVMADILDKRNAVVIDGMVRSLALYDTIVIPWGAMHMPAIEAAVLEEGFVARPGAGAPEPRFPHPALCRDVAQVGGEKTVKLVSSIQAEQSSVLSE